MNIQKENAIYEKRQHEMQNRRRVETERRGETSRYVETSQVYLGNEEVRFCLSSFVVLCYVPPHSVIAANVALSLSQHVHLAKHQLDHAQVERRHSEQHLSDQSHP